MNLRKFFAELKRRNVYKVAIAYAVVAWLLMQIASQIFPFFEIPNWAVRLVVLLLVIGFPVAVILAWAFELTPEGIKRTEEIEPGRQSRNRVWVSRCDFGEFVFRGALHKFKTKRRRRVTGQIDCRFAVRKPQP